MFEDRNLLVPVVFWHFAFCPNSQEHSFAWGCPHSTHAIQKTILVRAWLHVMKPALVLLVGRMIAAAPAGRLRLGVTLPDLRRQKCDGTGHIAGELT